MLSALVLSCHAVYSFRWASALELLATEMIDGEGLYVMIKLRLQPCRARCDAPCQRNTAQSTTACTDDSIAQTVDIPHGGLALCAGEWVFPVCASAKGTNRVASNGRETLDEWSSQRRSPRVSPPINTAYV